MLGKIENRKNSFSAKKTFMKNIHLWTNHFSSRNYLDNTRHRHGKIIILQCLSISDASVDYRL